MSRPLEDQEARERFRDRWDLNFAVAANAGSGKTTAISERLAALALAPEGGDLLRRTAVVTFTKKAAAQIGRRARAVLLRRLAERGPAGDLEPLDRLERAFFGTIHSFCLLLAQRHGHGLGLHLNPAVVEEEAAEALWEEFIEADGMQFSGPGPKAVSAFLRHVPLDSVFALARELDPATARRLAETPRPEPPPEPSSAVLEEILAARTRSTRGAEALGRNQETAVAWLRRWRGETGFLPIPRPEGKAGDIEALFARFFGPLKAWLAEIGGGLAAELALRYRDWRFERGIQTYADQVEAALAVLNHPATLRKIREENWRVLLDEAQDTDPEQFRVLVEIARPPESELGTWPASGGMRSGPPPRPGHFCLVGDGQQGIYSSRADIRNFQRHLEAFDREDGGELLKFDVTFRAPRSVIALLNATLPSAFGPGRPHNLGVPPAPGAPAPPLQVPYEPLIAGPENEPGAVMLLPLEADPAADGGLDALLAAEAGQVARFLLAAGPAALGARNWGEVCVLAPRNSWLALVRREFEAAGLSTALQMRRNRNRDHPVYAWISGLVAALCDPDNSFEWVGVLREVFAVSDAALAAALDGEERFRWEDPESYPEPVRGALETLRPFVGRVDAEGETLEAFTTDLARACGLAEKARRADPGGALDDELRRLLAQASQRGLEGAGPRAWLRDLLRGGEEGRPTGHASPAAINLLTAHSAKGLEWPVVIPVGLWRRIGKPSESGLRLIRGSGGEARVIFDLEGLSVERREARERERLREAARLLYVTLTRCRRTLVLPWGADFAAAEESSFAALWGAPLLPSSWLADQVAGLGVDAALATESGSGQGGEGTDPPPVPAGGAADLPASTSALEPESELEFEPSPSFVASAAAASSSAGMPFPIAAAGGLLPALPIRVLPHELALEPDRPRAARHESSLEAMPAGDPGTDPIDYGLWWHEALEFFPWTGDDAEVASYGEHILAAAAGRGFFGRAREEWDRFAASEARRAMRENRWTRLAELGVFAPASPGAWIDGVIDLVLHDPAAAELWIVDWKTNRRRSREDDEALLARLLHLYHPQLAAYGACAGSFFPGCAVRLLLYSTVAGEWRELPPAPPPSETS